MTTRFDVPEGGQEFLANFALGISFKQFFFSQGYDSAPLQCCAENAQECFQ
ncbi:hypothetical protein [Pseudomonas syringae group genomosp. 3]|uniref:hypothetical protein n=1 Tax=Pseudomonas syringae group genomosp. 3 TaxID=251701 RepID=UPI0016052260